jgi:hypothetical protein
VDESESKASGFNGAVRALQQLMTPAEFEKVMTKVSAETRELLRRLRLPVSWLPQRHFHELLLTADREIFVRDRVAQGRQAIRIRAAMGNRPTTNVSLHRRVVRER